MRRGREISESTSKTRPELRSLAAVPTGRKNVVRRLAAVRGTADLRSAAKRGSGIIGRMECTLTARWVFPVDGPPIERGVITCPRRLWSPSSRRGRAADIDLGNAAFYRDW